MANFTLTTTRHQRTPLRPQTWNGRLRAGDDFSLTLSVHEDDASGPFDVSDSVSALGLWPDEGGCCHAWDYGFGWFTQAPLGSAYGPAVIAGVPGQVTGEIEFTLPSATTAGLVQGRYRMSIQIATMGGAWSQIEGVLHVLSPWAGRITPARARLPLVDSDGNPILDSNGNPQYGSI